MIRTSPPRILQKNPHMLPHAWTLTAAAINGTLALFLKTTRKIVEEYCGTCSGQGLVEKTKQVKVSGGGDIGRDGSKDSSLVAITTRRFCWVASG